MDSERLLIVDDDVELCELVAEYLVSEGLEVEAVHDGDAGIERALSGEHMLIVLDVMLPGTNGFDALRRIRSETSIPVLMLTARGDDVDRIVGLELGADDYLSKPFNPRELIARVRAILRRVRPGERASGPLTRTLVAGDVELDLGSRVARRRDERIDLTSAEFDLLAALVRSAGQVVPREDLARIALGRELSALDRSVDMHVSNLRRKLGPLPGNFDRIKSVRGVGYFYATLGREEAE